MSKELLSEDAWLAKVKELKESGKFDLSLEEDLSLAIMNLISLEEHFFFTAEKTKRDQYFDLLSQVREMRKSLLGRMIDKHEGETWCICKHLLAASMRLIEVGTKLQSGDKKDEAKKMFSQAYQLYSIFWQLRLKLIDTQDLKKEPWTKEDILNKLIDCCKE